MTADPKALEIEGGKPVWSAAEPERAGWTPERTYPDGSKRQRFYMPALPKRQRKWFKQDGSTALERQEAKKQAQDAPPVFEGSRQMAERIDREQQGMTEQKEE